MNRLGHHDRAESPQVRRIILEVDLKFVQPLEVEGDAAQPAVDLKPVVVLAPGRHSCRLNGADGTTGKMHQRHRGIIDRDLPFGAWFAGLCAHGHKRLEVGRDLGDFADKESREVDRMRRDVTKGA